MWIRRVLALLFCLGWCSVGGAGPIGSDGNVRAVGRNLVAAERGGTLTLAAGTTVHLTAGATVAHTKSKLWLPKLGLLNCHVLTLSAGSAQVQSTKEAVVVRSGRLTVATTGGSMAVGPSTVMAERGKVWIRKREGWRWMREGQRVALAAGGDLTETSPPLPAPSLGAARVLAAPTGNAELGQVKWGAVAGANSYLLTVVRKDGREELLHHNYGGPASAKTTLSLAPGTYDVEVTALDEHGLPGTKGNLDVTVVGVQSAGAIASSSGVFMVEPKTPVHLTYIEGLEMKLGDSPEWFPAVASLNLRDGALAVHLRHPRSHATTRLDMGIKRRAEATVHIGPKTALWPQDTVVATIDLLAGPPGGSVSAGLRIESYIGTTPIDLSWEQTGNSMTAKIPMSGKAGPWVVRIAVFDADGVEVGRDNLEIACKAEAFCSPAPVVAARSKRPLTTHHTAKR